MLAAIQTSPLSVQAMLPALMVERRDSTFSLKVSNLGGPSLGGVRITLRSSAISGGKVTWLCPAPIAGLAYVESGPITVKAGSREGRYPVTCDVEFIDEHGLRIRGLSVGTQDASGMIKVLRGPAAGMSESTVVAHVAKELGMGKPEGEVSLDTLLLGVGCKDHPFLLNWEENARLESAPTAPVGPPLIRLNNTTASAVKAPIPLPPTVRAFAWKKVAIAGAALLGGAVFFLNPKNPDLVAAQPAEVVAAPALSPASPPAPAPKAAATPAPDVAPAVATPAAPAGFTNQLGMVFLTIPVGTGPGARQLGISRYETTTDDYLKFIKATSGTWTAPLENQKQHPVMNVTLAEAGQFCEWLTQVEGKARQYRLPTDEEWSWAVGIGELEAGLSPGQASGPPANKDGRLTGFPWGADSSVPAAVLSLPGLTGKQKALLPVTATWALPNGLSGLEGNVREWVSTPYDSATNLAVARGGSWGDTDFAKATTSARATSNGKHVTIGFRVCFSLPAK
jgi:Sulfatase-modifying factor enzyme 1